MDEDTRPDREDIQRRAFRRYEERGGTHGDDLADWFEAEREAHNDAEKRRNQRSRPEESVRGGGTRDSGAERAAVEEESARASGTGPTSTPTGTGPGGNVRNPGTAVSGGPTEPGR